MNLHKVEFIRSAAKPSDLIQDGLPQIAFAGKSNVGKSSVINRLLQRKNFARVGEAPGKTVHVNFFLVDGRATALWAACGLPFTTPCPRPGSKPWWIA